MVEIIITKKGKNTPNCTRCSWKEFFLEPAVDVYKTVFIFYQVIDCNGEEDVEKDEVAEDEEDDEVHAGNGAKTLDAWQTWGGVIRKHVHKIQTDQPTANRRRMDMRGHREVTLPINLKMRIFMLKIIDSWQ